MVTATTSDGAWPPPWLSAPALTAPEKAPGQPEPVEDNAFKPFGDDGFSFFDLIDVINPLQHLPIIGPLYREFTGDSLDPLPRIAGSTLFFGPIGAGISAANVVVEQSTGKDMGGHVLAWFDDETAPSTRTADAGPITDDEKTLAVTVGTDGLGLDEDPVSAWARQELAYRTAEVERRNLIAGKTPPVATPPGQPQITEVIRPAAAPSRPPRQAAVSAPPPDLAAFLNALGVRDVSAAIGTLETQKYLTVAANTANGQRTVAELKQATIAYTATAPDKPVGEKPTERKPTSPKALESGAIGRDGGWFSASMLGALEKYRAAETADPSAIGRRISEAY